MIFKSKIDLWFPVLTLGVALATLIAAFVTVRPFTLSAALVIFGVSLIAIGFPVWLLISTHYEVTDETLHIRSGPFRWEIPLHTIRAVRKSRSILSAPALSLDRLEIEYGNGHSVLVSPKDAQGFKRALGLM